MDDPQQQAVAQALRVEFQMERLKRNYTRRIRQLLDLARRDVLAAVGAQPADWVAPRLMQLLEEVEYALSLFDSRGRDLIASGALEAASQGVEMTRQVLRGQAPGVVLSPRVMLDARQIVTSFEALPSLITNVSNNTVHQVSQILRRSALAQMTPYDAMQQIAPRVGRGPFDLAAYRAEMILRTEYHRISQLSAQSLLHQVSEQYPQLDLRKRWITVSDHRTRPSHLAAHNQIVPVDQPFSVGGESLRFPGDPAGSAENTINCRCVVVPDRDEWLTRERELERLAREGGFTAEAFGEGAPEDGFMVSPYKDREGVWALEDFDAAAIRDYVQRNNDLLSQPQYFLGGWVHEGNVYLDVAVRRDTLESAIQLAVRHSQLAVFDLATMTEHTVKGYYEALARSRAIDNSMTNFIDHVRHEPIEYAMVLSSNTGQQVWPNSGFEAGDSTHVRIDGRYARGNIVVHSHPAPLAFSVQDIFSGAQLGVAEERVVTGQATYILRPGPNGWGLSPGHMGAMAFQHDYVTSLEHHTREATNAVLTTYGMEPVGRIERTDWLYPEGSGAMPPLDGPARDKVIEYTDQIARTATEKTVAELAELHGWEFEIVPHADAPSQPGYDQLTLDFGPVGGQPTTLVSDSSSEWRCGAWSLSGAVCSRPQGHSGKHAGHHPMTFTDEQW